jgi:tetratricopeptide (TPR) repeat protein
MVKPERNGPCPCGSGKKYKRCCALAVTASIPGGAIPARAIPARATPRADHETHRNLGNALRTAGRPAEAVAAHRRALEINPEDPHSHNDLGAALRDLGQIDAAVAEYRRALCLDPRLAVAHSNLGSALWEAGQSEEAEASYRRAIELAPNVAAFHNNLGNVLLHLGRPAAAILSYGSALELKPATASTLSNLASALRDTAQLDAAAKTYRQALALQPQSASIHVNLASVLRLQNKAAEAEAACLEGLRLDPRLPAALVLLGRLRADQGRFGEAEGQFEQARRIDPACVEAWSGIAGIRKMSAADAEWLAQVQRLADGALGSRREARLRYALGKYHDDVGDYRRAFACYRRANELAKRHTPKYDHEAFARRVGAILSSYDAAWLHRSRRADMLSERPVFVVGMPRSGTTLAEQILASHPAVFGANENTFWSEASADHKVPAGDDADQALATLATEYLRLLAEISPDAERVVDKMPANIFCLGLIHAAFPRARIIHMRRNPIDTCLSIYFQDLEAGYAFAHDLGDLADYYLEYQRVAAHWRALLPAESLLEVDYEALVSDQETVSRRMVEFIGLPWNDACLSHQRTRRVVTTLSNWQVRQKVHRGSIARWRNYADHLAPLLRLSAV